MVNWFVADVAPRLTAGSTRTKTIAPIRKSESPWRIEGMRLDMIVELLINVQKY